MKPTYVLVTKDLKQLVSSHCYLKLKKLMKNRTDRLIMERTEDGKLRKTN